MSGSVVGMLHFKCSRTVCQHVYAVDAHRYLIELGNVASASNGSYSYPKRYCPRCEASANAGGYESEREMDERMAKLDKEMKQ